MDHLGSPRVITDQNGTVTSRKDFSAFGEETITPQRTEGLGYVPPNIRQDYTGYQKDDESGLEFAQARYYNPTHGRFTSVDPLTASATIRNSQTFDRYAYALNSTYRFIDPLGLLPQGMSSWMFCGAQYSSCSEEGAGGY
jgi:RHS repeat-associated protein